MIISTNGQRILKILHLLAVCFWVGGGLSELVLFYTSATAQSDGELFGILRGSRYVSIYVVVYLGAFGSFFTGLAYSMCTNRGFFRHKWIIIKWATTVYLMISGTWFLGPWGIEVLETVQVKGLEVMSDPTYLKVRSELLTHLAFHLVAFVVLIVISVFKPWEVKESIRLLNKKLRVEK